MSSSASAPRIETRPATGQRLLDPPDDLPPLLERIYASRGVRSGSELNLELSALAPPGRLPDLDKAARRLGDAVERGEHVLIVGDFDADGATSVALGVSLLEALGAARVSFLVPNRFEFGYGLSPEIVALAMQRNPDVIVTVDNGVSSVEGVALAQRSGVDVIVTDHHLQGAELPPAHAIVNPNLIGSEFPSRSMAGTWHSFHTFWLRPTITDSSLRQRNPG